MKAIKYLGMLLAMLALSVSFVSCSSDDEDEDGGGNSSSVVGTWEGYEDGEDEEELVTMRFNSNGTGRYTEYCFEHEEIEEDDYFEWEQEGNIVYIWFEDDNDDVTGYLNGNTLVVQVDENDGDNYRFKLRRK